MDCILETLWAVSRRERREEEEGRKKGDENGELELLVLYMVSYTATDLRLLPSFWANDQ